MAEPGAAVAAGGLTTAEARERLRRYGPNALPEERPRPVLLFLRKLWAPIPWMLELTLIFELALGNFTQGAIITALLVLNATLSFVHEGRARKALTLLRQRLAVQARVLRDGLWQLLRAEDLVPGDVVHVRVGDFVPADLVLHDGHVQVDQSALTGESTPVEAEAAAALYAGSVVRRGEATGEVSATGSHSYYGKTAQLVHAAGAPSHLGTVIFTIVKYLVVLDALLIVAVLGYALVRGLPLTEIIPFTLILLVASVPVALPATYTLATALGSLELAGHGVLVTRLSAVEEAAAMDVLCSDKTGTLTKNELALLDMWPYPPSAPDDLLRLAALACDAATQDPIDLAILAAARARGLADGAAERLRFIPFDPSTKRSEAVVREGERTIHVVKGAPHVVADLAGGPDVAAEIGTMAGRGCRVLGVAAGPEGQLHMVGLLALQDPPREDSRDLVNGLGELGVRVVMVTGDGLATAEAVADQVGIKGPVCLADGLRAADGRALTCSVFAGVFPEDKFRLVQALQRAGHVTGMTGDGVNDAPALKQAEVGIAVASATDVAKAAASLVLTAPGLGGVLAALTTGRRIYQRMLTYTLNKIIKTLQVALLLSLGLLLTGQFLVTPRLVLLLLFANDFVTMSLASDRVSFSRRPDRWRVRPLVFCSLALAVAWLLFSLAVFLVGRDVLQFDLPRLQTFLFLMLVFTGQGTVYLVRQRQQFWKSVPGRWLVVASVADVVVVSLLATRGVLMAAIDLLPVAGLLAATALSLVLLDSLKVRLFRLFGVS